MIIETATGRFGLDDRGGDGVHGDRGVPVVFLHGFPHTRALWRHQLAALSVDHRCLAPDLRGFGESIVSGPWTMEQYAEDVRALLDALGIHRAVLAGLSMGGYVAMACWRLMPERILALALLDTQMHADDEAGRERRGQLIARVQQEGVAAVVEAQLPGMVGKTTRAQRHEVVAFMRRMMQSAPEHGIVGAVSAMRDRPDSAGTMGTVTVPTLIIVGDEDVLTPIAKGEAMMASLPPGTPRRMEVIASAGHVSCVERPAAVNHALSEFLGTLDTR